MLDRVIILHCLHIAMLVTTFFEERVGSAQPFTVQSWWESSEPWPIPKTQGTTQGNLFQRLKVHIYEWAEPQTEPRSITNTYIWTMKASPSSKNRADCQTILSDPLLASFSAKHKGIRGDVWTTIRLLRWFGESDEIYAIWMMITARWITSNLKIHLIVRRSNQQMLESWFGSLMYPHL